MLLKTGQLRVALWAKLDKETPISPCSQTECVHHSSITIFQKQLVWNLTQMDIEKKNPWIWEMFHLVCQDSSKAKAKVKKSSLFVSAAQTKTFYKRMFHKKRSDLMEESPDQPVPHSSINGRSHLEISFNKINDRFFPDRKVNFSVHRLTFPR